MLHSSPFPVIETPSGNGLPWAQDYCLFDTYLVLFPGTFVLINVVKVGVCVAGTGLSCLSRHLLY